ncbi:protein of unknown function [bacterium A37T11]|nr:protein of unknown function [bacterium A37T11]
MSNLHILYLLDMKFYIALSLFVIFISGLYQRGFTQTGHDYVITATGDTVVGTIRFPEEKRVRIKPNGESKYKTFKVNEAPEYYLAAYRETYLSCILPNKKNNSYLLCIERGPIDALRMIGYSSGLYNSGNLTGSGVGISTGGIGIGIGLNLNSKASALFLRKGNTPLRIINNKQWIKASKEKRKEQLAELMDDDPDLMNELAANNSRFNDDLVLSYVRDYNARQPTMKRKDADGFIDLFDGMSLKGWRGDSTRWRVENGQIIGEVTPDHLLQRNSFLIWEGGKPADFELVAEYMVSADGNSGINYRSEELPNVPLALKGYQEDIDGKDVYTGQNYEERGRTIVAFRGQQVELPPVEGGISEYVKNNIWTASKVTGSLGDRDDLKKYIKKGDWNEVHIVAMGNHIKHYVNGILMSEVMDNDLKNRKMSGLIGVQVHVGPAMTIAYRRIRLKLL